MADANCEVAYNRENDCCDVDLAPPTDSPPLPIITPPPPDVIEGPPGPQGPPGETGPQGPPGPPGDGEGSGCPYYCGIGSPEGVQDSTFEGVDVVGGEYLQLDADPTSHPWWAKKTLGGLTGWRPWAGLGSEGLLSYRIGDGSLASGNGSLAFGAASTAIGSPSVSIGNSPALGNNDIYIGWGLSGGVATAHPNILVGLNSVIGVAADTSSVTPSLHGGHIIVGENALSNMGPSQYPSIVLGRDAKSRGRALVVIGQEAEGRPADTPVVGRTEARFAVLVGYKAKGSGGCIIAVGDQADVRGDNSGAVGTHARANDHRTAAIGPNTFAGSIASDGSGTNSGAYGVEAQATVSNASAYGTGAVVRLLGIAGGAFGTNTFVEHEGATSLGFGANSKFPRTLMIGGHPDDGSDLVTGICFNGSQIPAIIVLPNGQIQINDTVGSTTSVQQPIAADRTLSANERSMMVNASAAVRTITLPLASAVPNATHVYVVKSDSSVNVVHVQRQGTDTLDSGTAQFDLTAQWKYCLFKRTSATNWNSDYFN